MNIKVTKRDDGPPEDTRYQFYTVPNGATVMVDTENPDKESVMLFNRFLTGSSIGETIPDYCHRVPHGKIEIEW